MRLTVKILRNLIQEQIALINEDGSDNLAGSSGLTDQQKKKLQYFSSAPPSSLSSFSSSMKTLGSILGEIDEKAANINSGQIKLYFMQIMKIVESMMSEDKTSSAETSKITKAINT